MDLQPLWRSPIGTLSTCQKVKEGSYRCLVEGFFGFLKGRCNILLDEVCNDDKHNNDCNK